MGGLPPTEAGQQFCVNSAKTAVAEDANDIPALGCFTHMLHNGIDVREVSGGFALAFNVLHQARRIQALVQRDLIEACDLRYYHLIGIDERACQFLLEYVSPSGVGAGLEDSPKTAASIANAQGAERFANRGRMMPEIINDSDAAADATHFHAALDSFEGVEGGLNL